MYFAQPQVSQRPRPVADRPPAPWTGLPQFAPAFPVLRGSEDPDRVWGCSPNGGPRVSKTRGVGGSLERPGAVGPRGAFCLAPRRFGPGGAPPRGRAGGAEAWSREPAPPPLPPTTR